MSAQPLQAQALTLVGSDRSTASILHLVMTVVAPSHAVGRWLLFVARSKHANSLREARRRLRKFSNELKGMETAEAEPDTAKVQLQAGAGSERGCGFRIMPSMPSMPGWQPATGQKARTWDQGRGCVCFPGATSVQQQSPKSTTPKSARSAVQV